MIAVIGVIMPISQNSGPYVIQESDRISTVSRSMPWRLSTERITGFLHHYLAARFEWSNETFELKRKTLQVVTTDSVYSKLKESIIAYSAITKSQNARGFYILEGFQYSNEKRIIEALVSRVIRVGNTGVVTPLKILIEFDEARLNEQNPYGITITSLNESETTDPERGAQ